MKIKDSKSFIISLIIIISIFTLSVSFFLQSQKINDITNEITDYKNITSNSTYEEFNSHTQNSIKT